MLTRKKRRLNQEDDTKILREILSPDDIKVFDPVTLNNLKNVIRTLADREPNIVQIVNSDIDLCHKANLVELCEIYKNLDPLTEDSLRIKNLINKRFADYSNEARELNSLPTHLKQKYAEFKTTGSSNLLVKILTLKTSQENTKTLIRKYQELRNTSGEEYNKLKKWINYALDLPHDILSTSPKLNVGVLEKVAVYMENHIYGLKSVKEQILLFLSGKLQNKNTRGCSIGLLGPPGVGKTVLAKCIGKCLSFPFQQISFGGITNPEFLTGHDYTYIGSRPGEIVRCLSRMKSKNGILFFDEFDKISTKKDICSTLLHITDPSQNSTFRDNYLADITIDLSNLWFIYSMNNQPSDSALRDRIFIIEIKGYTTSEKIEIFKRHLLPSAIKSLNLSVNDIKFSGDVIKYLITQTDKYEDNKGGVRYLERLAKDLCRKINLQIKVKDNIDLSFRVDTIKKYPVLIDDIETLNKLLQTPPEDMGGDKFMLYL